ncbi:MAG: phosphatase PAP2 family protein [Flavobacteriales bacterium]
MHRSVAQSPYSFNTGRELGIVVPGLVFQGVSLLHPVPIDSLWRRVSTTDRADLPAFDRPAAYKWNLQAHRTSNVLLGVDLAGSLTMSLVDRPTPDMGTPVVLMGETMLLTVGLTNMVKVLVHRPRPYAYNPDVPLDVRKAKEAYVSFWSGHTATAAAMAFASAELVQQSDASSTAKTITWSTAITLPMLIGHYRVRAGRHFRTDVIVGYLVGAGIGMAVPYIHHVGNDTQTH